MGIAFFVTSFACLTGTPIDGALLNHTFPWFKPIIFSGVCVLVFCIVECRNNHRFQTVILGGIPLLAIGRTMQARRKKTQRVWVEKKLGNTEDNMIVYICTVNLMRTESNFDYKDSFLIIVLVKLRSHLASKQGQTTGSILCRFRLISAIYLESTITIIECADLNRDIGQP